MFKLPLVVYIVQIEYFLLVEFEIYHHHLFNMYISLLYCCTFGILCETDKIFFQKNRLPIKRTST